ncbi:HEPN domain-containing protein [Galbitalea soli]|uniref:HEPN domain-containing protein n=1 Tax=Galbitalea soli TaxID=1268042 RepID=A0A7C9PPT3_9MICO|nr:HEPN domain-containing protein [Galbitalea soli]NEM92369.1 HEPN domain-containing protein [Galbitalea soli]NYJ31674.1 hypothetical protein [Galbitalea soli]
MLTRWENGRAEIDRLIAQGRLSKVAANRDLADSYLQAARSHVLSATVLSGSDPEGAFQLAYDAARKALAAILVNQGLRAGGQGAHLTIYEAVRAQLDPPKGKEIRLFDWMRRLRNSTEYPDTGDKTADVDDVSDAIPVARSLIELAEGVLDVMPVY